jgi:hypothetical protein
MGMVSFCDLVTDFICLIFVFRMVELIDGFDKNVGMGSSSMGKWLPEDCF